MAFCIKGSNSDTSGKTSDHRSCPSAAVDGKNYTDGDLYIILVLMDMDCRSRAISILALMQTLFKYLYCFCLTSFCIKRYPKIKVLATSTPQTTVRIRPSLHNESLGK